MGRNEYTPSVVFSNYIVNPKGVELDIINIDVMLA